MCLPYLLGLLLLDLPLLLLNSLMVEVVDPLLEGVVALPYCWEVW